MKATDLREKGADDLRELQKSLASDVFQNRIKNFTNRLDDTSGIRKTKRDLARVTTLLREVELGIRRTTTGTAKAAPVAKAPEAAEAKPKKAAAKKTASAAAKTTATATKSSSSKKSAKKGEAKQS
jgi:large subunit ribosomal protein L29